MKYKLVENYRQCFCIKLKINQKSLPIYHIFFALKRCTYSGPWWWLGLFRPNSSSRPRKLFVSRGDEVTRFLRFSKPNFVRKTMCETIEKIALLSVFFKSILWIKKYFKVTLFALKMRYLNKQGQQASWKISKHPGEVITRWRSYTIWRYLNACDFEFFTKQMYQCQKIELVIKRSCKHALIAGLCLSIIGSNMVRTSGSVNENRVYW